MYSSAKAKQKIPQLAKSRCWGLVPKVVVTAYFVATVPVFENREASLSPEAFPFGLVLVQLERIVSS